MHIIGASGTGKSTLLFNLIKQDIENGEGVALLDPHVELVERILGIIPEHRTDDVVLIDPADEESFIGFNISPRIPSWKKASWLPIWFRSLNGCLRHGEIKWRAFSRMRFLHSWKAIAAEQSRTSDDS